MMTKLATLTAPELQHAIEQFLYSEATLLDEHRYHEWLELLADDVHYWMPVRSNRLCRDLDHEFSRPHEVAHFDEDKASLKVRIKRLDTGSAWAENPPSRTRHMVSNVQVTPSENGAEFTVLSALLLYRSRGERQVDTFVGRREDLLRRAPNPYGFELARRSIYLDQTLLSANNLSIFF
jgi:biphenyl 2,3-dioxygenase beta subunit